MRACGEKSHSGATSVGLLYALHLPLQQVQFGSGAIDRALEPGDNGRA